MEEKPAVKKFSDMGIKEPKNLTFSGDKISINKVLDRPIIVQKYKVEPSNFKDKGDGKRLTMQLIYSGKQHILWTNSMLLREQISQVPEENLPFETTIKEDNKGFKFT
ncbi:MAG TPA: hypothetical protein VN698_12980 [Bacteroidia bacterium]|nr:hypothetical protein [Bacteroidia bacterium]